MTLEEFVNMKLVLEEFVNMRLVLDAGVLSKSDQRLLFSRLFYMNIMLSPLC
jgi:hypothetical protein